MCVCGCDGRDWPCSQSHVKKSEKEGSDGALWNFPVAFFEKRTFEEQRKMNRLRESQSLCIEAQRVCLDPPGTQWEVQGTVH